MIFLYRGIQGFDVSTHQDSPLVAGHINFDAMKAWGARFVIIRAGQGNWMDPDFPNSWTNAKGILPRAPYWYYDNRYNPRTQAEVFFATIKGDPEGICWLDLEDPSDGIWGGHQNWYDFIMRLQELMPGVRIGIYTSYGFWFAKSLGVAQEVLAWFGQFPLWLASYPVDPFNPNYLYILVPQPWWECLILQSGTPGIGLEVGVESRDIDYNQFNGGEEIFAQYFTAIDGGPMSQHIEGTVVQTVRLRSGPGTDYPTALWNGRDYLQAGTGIKAIYPPTDGKWLHLTEIQGAVVTGDLWSSAGSLQQYIAWHVVTVPDEPPPPAPVKKPFTLTVEGYKPFSGELEQA